mmetsp:Transcript_8659/g.25193  ORF Transcript_8659/g.25193 Transcript_8659/m.25193 type:complete len:809 (-) Transcript_8659:244-2670(-)
MNTSYFVLSSTLVGVVRAHPGSRPWGAAPCMHMLTHSLAPRTLSPSGCAARRLRRRPELRGQLMREHVREPHDGDHGVDAERRREDGAVHDVEVGGLAALAVRLHGAREPAAAVRRHAAAGHLVRRKHERAVRHHAKLLGVADILLEAVVVVAGVDEPLRLLARGEDHARAGGVHEAHVELDALHHEVLVLPRQVVVHLRQRLRRGVPRRQRDAVRRRAVVPADADEHGRAPVRQQRRLEEQRRLPGHAEAEDEGVHRRRLRHDAVALAVEVDVLLAYAGAHGDAAVHRRVRGLAVALPVERARHARHGVQREVPPDDRVPQAAAAEDLGRVHRPRGDDDGARAEPERHGVAAAVVLAEGVHARGGAGGVARDVVHGGARVEREASRLGRLAQQHERALLGAVDAPVGAGAAIHAALDVAGHRAAGHAERVRALHEEVVGRVHDMRLALLRRSAVAEVLVAVREPRAHAELCAHGVEGRLEAGEAVTEAEVARPLLQDVRRRAEGGAPVDGGAAADAGAGEHRDARVLVRQQRRVFVGVLVRLRLRPRRKVLLREVPTLLQHGHAQAARRQHARRRAAASTGADHDDVEVLRRGVERRRRRVERVAAPRVCRGDARHRAVVRARLVLQRLPRRVAHLARLAVRVRQPQEERAAKLLEPLKKLPQLRQHRVRPALQKALPLPEASVLEALQPEAEDEAADARAKQRQHGAQLRAVGPGPLRRERRRGARRHVHVRRGAREELGQLRAVPRRRHGRQGQRGVAVAAAAVQGGLEVPPQLLLEALKLLRRHVEGRQQRVQHGAQRLQLRRA